MLRLGLSSSHKIDRCATRPRLTYGRTDSIYLPSTYYIYDSIDRRHIFLCSSSSLPHPSYDRSPSSPSLIICTPRRPTRWTGQTATESASPTTCSYTSSAASPVAPSPSPGASVARGVRSYPQATPSTLLPSGFLPRHLHQQLWMRRQILLLRTIGAVRRAATRNS